MGAIVNALYGTPLDTGIDPNELSKLSIFWEQVGRLLQELLDCTCVVSLDLSWY